MKTRNYLVMAAALTAFSSCSNDETTTTPEVGGNVIPEMTIRLASPTTYADVQTDPGVGNESVLGNTLVFVNTTDGKPGALASYKQIPLTGGATQTTVKFPVNGSQVFVFSNLMGDYEIAAGKCTTQAELEGLSEKIEKSYISGLTSKGSFIMSGKATVVATGGASPYSLSVALNRDLAKVAFSVKKKTLTMNVETKALEEDAKSKLLSVTGIKVMRASDKVAPFNGTGYALPLGENDLGYKEDDATNDAEASADATDYSFKYNKSTADATAFNFNSFYVLPNYADRSSRGTIILLETKMAQTENDITGATRFYKARISKSLDTFITTKNTSYVISATVVGKGYETEDEAQKEDEDNQLNVTIDVAPWGVEFSDQTLN